MLVNVLMLSIFFFFCMRKTNNLFAVGAVIILLKIN